MNTVHQAELRAWDAICDRCGFKFRNYMLRKEWTGFMVCFDCWDYRHPQDFVRGVPDPQVLPWTRPDPPPVFLNVGDVKASDL